MNPADRKATNIKIDKFLWRKFKDFCIDKDIRMRAALTTAIREFMERDKED